MDERQDIEPRVDDYPGMVAGSDGDDNRNDTDGTWVFFVSLYGSGETVEDGWRDACESFNLDPGDVPGTVLTESEMEQLMDDLCQVKFSTGDCRDLLFSFPIAGVDPYPDYC